MTKLKAIKVKKKWLADFERMYRDLGLVTGKEGQEQALVSQVFASPRTQKMFESALRKAVRKAHPGILPRRLASSVAFHMLNLSPVTLEGVADGYLIVHEQ